MAPVNPQINPTNDPNYLGYSQAITPPDNLKPKGQEPSSIQPTGVRHVDESKGLAYANLGNLFEGTTKGLAGVASNLDYIIKKDIQDEVYTGVDRERERETNRLEAIQRQIEQGKTPMNLLDSAETELPTEIESVGATAETLKGARNIGRINHIDYHSRLTAFSKSLRNLWPGYRDYIDSEISKVSGIDPANAKLASLTSGINRSIAAQAASQNKTEALLRANIEMEGAPLLLKGLREGTISELQVFDRVHKYQRYINQFKIEELERARAKGKLEAQKSSAERELDLRVASKVQNYIGIMETQGYNQEFMDDVLAGRTKVGSPQWDQFAAGIENYRAKAYKEAWAEANKVDEKGNSLVSSIGSEAAKQKIEAGLAPFDEWSKRIRDPHKGQAFFTSRAIKAREADWHNNLLDSNYLGPVLLNANTLGKADPKFAELFFTKKLMTEFGKIDNALSTYTTNQQMNMVTQKAVDLSTGAGFTTLKSVIEDASKKKIRDDLLPTVYQDFINFTQDVDKINDPELKKNMIHAVFDPSNRGLLDKFRRDYYDSSKGKWIPGSYSVFSRITSDKMLGEVAKINDPQLTNTVVDTASTMFARELYRKEIQDLFTLQDNPSIKVTWDSENYKWKLDRPRVSGGYFNPVTHQEQMGGVQQILTRLNTGIESMVRVAKLQGKDPNAYVLGLFVDVSRHTGKELQGIPLKLRNSIMSSRPPVDESPGSGGF